MFQSSPKVNYEEADEGEEEDELSFEFGDHKLTNKASQRMPIQVTSKNADLYYEEKDSYSWKDILTQCCQCLQWRNTNNETEHLKVNNRSLYTRN